MVDLTRERVGELIDEYDPEEFPEWTDEFPPELETQEDEYDRVRLTWLISPQNYEPDDISDRYGEELQLLMESFEDENILDLGCSYRSGISALAGDSNNVVQLDKENYLLSILDKYKDEIKERKDNVLISELVTGDMEWLPFRRDSFDVVFAGASDQFVENSEVLRVLEDEGDIVIGSCSLENYSNLENYLDEQSGFDPKIVDYASKTMLNDGIAYLSDVKNPEK